MTYEDLYFLAAIGSLSVSEKMNVLVYPCDTRGNADYEEKLFEDIDCHMSMCFSMTDITSFVTHLSLTFTSPVNGKFMCYKVEVERTVSDLLSISKLDYVKMLAVSAIRTESITIQMALEHQIASKGK